MIRTAWLATSLALAGIAVAPAWAQAPAQPTPSATLAPGQRMSLPAAMGQRVVRHVMISNDGGGIDIVYDMPAGSPQSQRVLRLENVNGMLEVIYDTAMPSRMPLGTGGTPRLVPRTDGGYEVVYDR